MNRTLNALTTLRNTAMATLMALSILTPIHAAEPGSSEPSSSRTHTATAPSTPTTPGDAVDNGATLPLRYVIQPGDLLQISVWREKDLQAEVAVGPDGIFSFPLVGDVMAAGKTVTELRQELVQRVRQYVSNPLITVSIKQPRGNRIYVVGKVSRPGEYTVTREVDVMQALSLAGGTTPFAALHKIKVLRRSANGEQHAIEFPYNDIERGRHLERNIVLQGGDVVVVP